MKNSLSKLSFVLLLLGYSLLPSRIFAATVLTNPLAGEAKSIGVGQLVATFVQGVLGFSGVVATIFIIYGGALIAFGSANEQQFAKGKKTITFAIIGLLVSLLGFYVLTIITGIVNQVSGL